MTQRAVVVGGSIAGLCAAAALDHAGFSVTVLERDDPVAAPAHRPGSPQSRQLHNLLGRAQHHLERLFPGFGDALCATGAARARVASQTHVFELGVVMPERDCGLHLVSAPRPVVEAVARDLLPDRVDVRSRIEVTGLRLAGDAVVGVETADGLASADLVVDAAGAQSPVTRWLQQQDRPTPRQDTFDVRQWYCTVVVQRPDAWIGVPDFWLTFPTYPASRGGLVSPVGNDGWYVSLSGTARDPAPRSWPDFLAYAATLERPDISELLRHAVPTGSPTLFGRPRATWRRWDTWDDPVAGLVAVGDAVAALNPLLGQGVSVAAWQASELGAIATHDDGGAAYRAAAGRVAGSAWALTRIFDPGAVDGVPRLDDAAWSTIVRVVATDDQAHRRYVRVWHLLEPPSALADIAAGRTEDLG